ncbi:M48 family metallopeptidase [Mesonia sp. K7]|uniref:tetratricopeptide repeat protein n=1 Tax=Mesonia sp. K7 TaxID=2218606 RepID=UPI000DA8B1FD|nr:hypothetical protein [Mesonia sp. K7]PZD78539.1 hypothetical protein DNG35_05615 [Mesonia sp. K7]
MGIIITVVFSAIILFLGYRIINTLNVRVYKNNIDWKISNDTANREETLAILNYATNKKIDLDKGKKYINYAEQKFPDDKEVLLIIGKYYLELEQPKLAYEYIEKANRVYPNQADVLCNMGLYYYRIGELKNAQEFKDKAIEIDNDYTNFKFN